MTQEERLQFCKQCTNRKMDFNTGLQCSLTGNTPNFIDECENFTKDETVNLASNHVTLEGESAGLRVSDKVIEHLKSEQDYKMGLIATIVAGCIGALLWCIITVATGYQIGYMAIGVGAGVGFTMRYFGKGLDPIFGITGAIIAVVSCILGNILSIIGFVAEANSLEYFEALTMFDYSLLPDFLIEGFSFMDLLFYGFAAYEGYNFAFRRITEEEIVALNKSENA